MNALDYLSRLRKKNEEKKAPGPNCVNRVKALRSLCRTPLAQKKAVFSGGMTATPATLEPDEPATVAVAELPEPLPELSLDEESNIQAWLAYTEEPGPAVIKEALAAACKGIDITPAEVNAALSEEDIDDWRKGAMSTDTLAAFARSLVQRSEMDLGKRPEHYTEHATCQHCGPIWLWFSGKVMDCPWCRNREADRPIPRPGSIHCGDCSHFERIDHPHLGHCAKGEPEAAAGLWGTDRRHCERFIPIHQ